MWSKVSPLRKQHDGRDQASNHRPQDPGGGGLPYETDGGARRKIRNKPLKETNLGVAQALFEPKTRPR